MKIDSTLAKVGQLRPEENKARRPETAPSTPAQPAKADASIDLTRTSTRLQQLESQLASIPEIDMGKVETVRQAIADGKFDVNEDAIAEKLLNNVVEGLKQQVK
ncbi:FlgM family anti-sigma-28 factor [Sulfuritortus calidifontis]|uniref:Negative regulator of flagellin synthesis n=1 Tax=Sulfuritortus calidifontis TaxID=1914471 RepID=A0A4R3JWT7_9PROT|nr:flagellar biosynthesis anti-sigma factor FlgM [Sulfuritortus calidifontis]TCS71523.1 FlgM family anti-sigma-28 factor [Sulfuritortus calidifontis]